jgi:hypothetical protein
MSEAHMRKLTGLALCLLLPTNDPQLLQRTPLILGVVTSVLADTHQNPFECVQPPPRGGNACPCLAAHHTRADAARALTGTWS